MRQMTGEMEIAEHLGIVSCDSKGENLNWYIHKILDNFIKAKRVIKKRRGVYTFTDMGVLWYKRQIGER